ncbi:Lactate dehydrogenase [Jatrophihabitans endophyticus]|uniref:Lactate dehydrogenase n=1 Tax=Jatrophihabitans endophyticus TaxID=1206085 RepID=A0A1M5DHE7_9ACTN|nr:D-2-hydroxyacid dehydrogenase family protein [Jatrophihabitans endophyticus]SHF66390.1 Lactate dehydrogenase [Jatrophihabitans endophyticus]
MATVVVLDDYQGVALDSADWTPITDRFDVRVETEHVADRDELVARLRDAQVVVAMRERTAFPADLLRALPELRLLVTTGMKNAAIDVPAARELGIEVCGTTGSGNAVAELTLGMMIALTRNFAAEDAGVRRGGWQHTIGPGLAGLTLGVVGLGRLGIPVSRLARAFAMDVVAWSPNLTAARAAEHDARAVSKRELFEQADVVTIHLPLSERSRGLVGAAEFSAMRPSSYLVNTSRGPIVDEAALLDALRSRRIAGAALDVYDVEPLPADHPLRTMPNTLLLPHLGYVTTDAYRTFFAQAVEDVVAWADGRPVRSLD